MTSKIPYTKIGELYIYGHKAMFLVLATNEPHSRFNDYNPVSPVRCLRIEIPEPKSVIECIREDNFFRINCKKYTVKNNE